MRGFAQTLFNALLGWIRTLVEGVWNILFSGDAQQWLNWIGDNWMVLFVFLCLCGVALDYVIWFFRWRPYYVWGSSMRRMRRFFGGREAQRAVADDRPKDATRQAAYRNDRRRPEPVYQQPEEPVYNNAGFEEAYAGQDEQYAADPAFEQESIYEQVPMYEPAPVPVYEPQGLVGQPQLTAVFQKPPIAADTILARPRKADYQDQYVRRFARPEPAPEHVYDPVPQDNWSTEPKPYEPVYDAAPQEEYWAPEMTEDTANHPIHPGIDYQAMSRQYGWHVEKGEDDLPSLKQAANQTKQPPSDSSWDFSGLESFAPYHAPEVKKPDSQRPERVERTKKPKAEGSPLNKVRSGLSRIAQRASKVLTVDDEQAGKLIDGLPPPIDKRRAFHAPVYPNRPGSDKQKSPDFQEDD